jgi:hypothetical protein
MWIVLWLQPWSDNVHMLPGLLLDETTIMLFEWSLSCDNTDQGWQFTAFITTNLFVIF